MALATIIILFLVFKALKAKRPLMVVLTPEEAEEVKTRWWAIAKGEVIAWVICIGILGAILGQDVASAHWKPVIYVAIVWGSFILFSRLAIWSTLAISVPAYLVGAVGIHLWPPACPFVMVSFCVFAIGFRAVLFFFYACQPVEPLAQPRQRRVYELEKHDS